MQILIKGLENKTLVLSKNFQNEDEIINEISSLTSIPEDQFYLTHNGSKLGSNLQELLKSEIFFLNIKFKILGGKVINIFNKGRIWIIIKRSSTCEKKDK